MIGVVWLVLAWRRGAVTRDLEDAFTWLASRARGIVLLVAAASAAVSIGLGSYSASGADASGYLSEAAMLARGSLTRAEALASLASWPDSAITLAPLGWRPAPISNRQVPTYAVGLPLLMAMPHALGGALAASLVVSAATFVSVWLTGRLAWTFAGPAAAIIASTWLATSPITLYESLQPMSDVPVVAAWLCCWWSIVVGERRHWIGASSNTRLTSRHAVLAGVAAAVAVLIRPNLAPLALVPALAVLTLVPDSRTFGRLANFVAFSLPVAVIGVLIAWLQWRWFGSPLRSGYGTAEELYAASNVMPNARLYLAWLLETHGPWLLAAPLAVWIVRAPLIRWLFAFAALVCVAYFLYAVFDNWTYLRFMLPALAVAIVGLSAAVASVIERWPIAQRFVAVVAVVFGLAFTQVNSAKRHDVFGLASRHSRVLLGGHYLASAARPSAVFVTGEQSGAIRYYTDRSIVRWDLLQRDAFEVVQQQLESSRHELWIALDYWEEELFRAKFRSAAIAALDWPPAVEAGRELRMKAWRVADRARFMRGERVMTDVLR